MNARIRELIEQAGMTRILDEHAHEYGNGMFENTPYPEVEKFAELILKDCCEILLKWKSEPFPFDEDVAVSLLKEYFNIKK
jgi:hypothetical protein